MEKGGLKRSTHHGRCRSISVNLWLQIPSDEGIRGAQMVGTSEWITGVASLDG